MADLMDDDEPDLTDLIDQAFDKGGPREAVIRLRDGLLCDQPPHTPGMPCAACTANVTAQFLTYVLNKWN